MIDAGRYLTDAVSIEALLSDSSSVAGSSIQGTCSIDIQRLAQSPFISIDSPVYDLLGQEIGTLLAHIDLQYYNFPDAGQHVCHMSYLIPTFQCSECPVLDAADFRQCFLQRFLQRIQHKCMKSCLSCLQDVKRTVFILSCQGMVTPSLVIQA